jgi:diaminopimelate decarboxylase
MKTLSPNLEIRPATASINSAGHLTIGGCDTVALAKEFGTPLWIMDEESIVQAMRACIAGLSSYPQTRIFYAGKAFLCQAMCKLIDRHGLHLDVVSGGELFTALSAGFPANKIFMHGNNKSADEIHDAIKADGVTIVVDNHSELELIISISRALLAEKASVSKVPILFRVTPGVEAETHQHIQTGHHDSKFGFAIEELDSLAEIVKEGADAVNLIGLHAHIGSQTHKIEPYLEIVDILADCFVDFKKKHGITLSLLDVGGGLGIAYNDQDKPLAMDVWTQNIAQRVKSSFSNRGLDLPILAVEPGRSIVGTAGTTLYTAGHAKSLPSGLHYLAVDGGMADNPRPITYQALYTACIANRANAPLAIKPLTLVGKYCESGDIIIKETYIPAQTGDIVAVFGTGAYNYSMASNYNRTRRPACVLVKEGKADVIIERESVENLIQQDRVPARLLTD